MISPLANDLQLAEQTSISVMSLAVTPFPYN